MNLLVLFIVLNVLNVIMQTIKNLATIKCGKTVASIVNAITFGLYTVVIVYMNCDLPLYAKVLVVAGSNLIGVYVVKYFEEKMRKDKMWKIEMSIPKEYAKSTEEILTLKEIPHNYIEVGNYTMFNCYCEEQKDTSIVKNIAKNSNGKISAYQSENLF